MASTFLILLRFHAPCDQKYYYIPIVWLMWTVLVRLSLESCWGHLFWDQVFTLAFSSTFLYTRVVKKNICSSATTGILIILPGCQHKLHIIKLKRKQKKQEWGKDIIPYVPGETANGSGDHS